MILVKVINTSEVCLFSHLNSAFSRHKLCKKSVFSHWLPDFYRLSQLLLLLLVVVVLSVLVQGLLPSVNRYISMIKSIKSEIHCVYQRFGPSPSSGKQSQTDSRQRARQLGKWLTSQSQSAHWNGQNAALNMRTILFNIPKVHASDAQPPAMQSSPQRTRDGNEKSLHDTLYSVDSIWISYTEVLDKEIFKCVSRQIKLELFRGSHYHVSTVIPGTKVYPYFWCPIVDTSGT